ncbi:MAG TPA: zf-HC2 domain-containing protein [Ktedonobacteraceae bacterium]|nr:zf-HC2 domain-containing protein [Ktedonobacteraceae bacterium]
MECLDCVEITARLHLYIDRELNSEEITIVQQHLEQCPHCECRFHFDLHIKRLLHERCTMVHAPAHLREAMMRLARGEHVEINPELEMGIMADLEGCD